MIEITDDSDKSLGIEKELVSIYSDFLHEVPELKKEVTFQNAKKMEIHNWFQYTQGFSPGLLSHYVEKWSLDRSQKLLDPFVGSGTSLVFCQHHEIQSEGWDISPLAVLLSEAKTAKFVDIDVDSLKGDIEQNILVLKDLQDLQDLDKYPPQIVKHLNKSFPEDTLKEILAVRKAIDKIENNELRKISLVAFISTLEKSSYIRKHGSHYRFMNTENTGVQRKLDFTKIDYKQNFYSKLEEIIREIGKNQSRRAESIVKLQDARFGKISGDLATFVITSPPYLNRNNYIAQSKIEMFLSGLLTTFDEYRDLTKKTLRSHVEAGPIEEIPSLECSYVGEICKTVLERGESYKGVSQMIEGYFDDMSKAMQNLADSLDSGAMVALAVGCSRWSGVVVPTDLLIAHHAIATGHYKLKSVDVVRYKGNAPQQMAKWGRYPVRESVLVMERL
jgi:hypothetical protein